MAILFLTVNSRYRSLCLWSSCSYNNLLYDMFEMNGIYILGK